jgi:hypothetical protein
MRITGKRIVVFLLVVLVVVIAGIALAMDVLVKKGIERGSEHALGVETSVGSVDLGVLSGNFAMTSFRANNPEGFESPEFLVLEDCRLSTGIRNILADTVAIDEIVLDGIQINLEVLGKESNFTKVLDHIKSLDSGGESSDQDGKKKQFIIRDLRIMESKAQLRVKIPQIGVDKQKEVEIPEIHLTNVGSDKKGVDLAQVTSIVITRILDSVARSGYDLPGEIESRLRGEVRSVLAAHSDWMGASQMAGEESVEEAVEGVVDEAKKKLGDLLDN